VVILLQPVDRLHLHVYWAVCGYSFALFGCPAADLLRCSTPVGATSAPDSTSALARSPGSRVLPPAPSWGPWGGRRDTRSVARSFNTMTLAPPTSFTHWVADSGASYYTTPNVDTLSSTLTIPFLYRHRRWVGPLCHLSR
jgi:hypothetical protein